MRRLVTAPERGAWRLALAGLLVATPLVLAGAALSSRDVGARLAASSAPWSQVGGGPGHTGWNPTGGSRAGAARLSLAWRAPLSAPAETSPVIFGDRVVVAVEGAAYGFDRRTGLMVWRRRFDPTPVTSHGFPPLGPVTPAFGQGIVVVRGDDDVLYALDPRTGRTVWRRSLGGFTVDGLAVSGSLVFASQSNNLYVEGYVLASGRKVWPPSDWSSGSSGSAPVTIAGGRMLTSDGYSITAYDLRTARQRWMVYPLGTPAPGQLVTPVFADSSTAYVEMEAASLHGPGVAWAVAVDLATGRTRWHSRIPGVWGTAPALGPGVLYSISPVWTSETRDRWDPASCRRIELAANRTSDGRALWRTRLTDDCASGAVAPAVGGDIIYTAFGRRVAAFDPHGRRVWSAQLPQPATSPLAVAGGQLIVAAGSSVYAFAPGARPPRQPTPGGPLRPPGTTVLVSATPRGGAAGGARGIVSPTGRFVVFSAGDVLLVRDRDSNGNGRLDEPGEGRTAEIARRGDYSPQAISADGRLVAYVDYVEVDEDADHEDAYLIDRDLNGNGTFDEPGDLRPRGVGSLAEYEGRAAVRISADGRFVASQTRAGVSLLDPSTGRTATMLPHGLLTGMSASGRFLTFTAYTRRRGDAYVLDRDPDRDGVYDEPGAGRVALVSLSSAGARGDASSAAADVSADGRYVIFTSTATNLVRGDTNEAPDVFIRARDADGDGVFDEPGAARTYRVSVATTGAQGDGPSSALGLSPDGRYVAFSSDATSLVRGDTNGAGDVFVRDLDSDGDGRLNEATAVRTTRVSLAATGAQLASGGTGWPGAWGGGWVSFASSTAKVVLADANGVYDVYVRGPFR